MGSGLGPRPRSTLEAHELGCLRVETAPRVGGGRRWRLEAEEECVRRISLCQGICRTRTPTVTSHSEALCKGCRETGAGTDSRSSTAACLARSMAR